MRFTSLLMVAAAAACLPAFASVDPGLLALVPPATKVIASIDVQRAESSGLGQHLLARSQTDNGFQQFVEQTGFDPRRDLQTIVLASAGSRDQGGKGAFAILARGTFDVDRITAAATAKGAVAQPYDGVTLFLEPSKSHANAFAFPDVGVAVIGDPATLRNIIANRATATTLDPALQDQISRVSPNNDAWFASSIPAPVDAGSMTFGKNQAVPTQALQSIVQSSGGIRFGDIVNVTLDATARSANDAQSLADVARFIGSMVQMQAQSNPKAQLLASSINNMQVATNGNQVHILLSLPEQMLENLADLQPKGPRHVRVR